MSESNLYFRLPRANTHDARGSLFKCLTGFEVDLPDDWGEVYAVTLAPGTIRGRHLHLKAREFFTVVAGTLRLELFSPVTGASETLVLTPQDNVSIEIPPGIAHALHNDKAETLVVVAVSSHSYDPLDAVPCEWELPAQT